MPRQRPPVPIVEALRRNAEGYRRQLLVQSYGAICASPACTLPRLVP